MARSVALVALALAVVLIFAAVQDRAATPPSHEQATDANADSSATQSHHLASSTRDKQWKSYHYCPVCGHKLHAQQRDNLTFPVCSNPECGYVVWESRTPRPCTTLFITRGAHDERILMTIRARDPQKGLLDFPGGFLQPGEHPFDNARREMAEELGLRLRPRIEHVGYAQDVYGPDGPPTLQIGLAVSIAPNAVPKPADDVYSVRWVDPHSIDESNVFAPQGQVSLLKAWLRRRGLHRRGNGGGGGGGGFRTPKGPASAVGYFRSEAVLDI